jgi:hypothetical protein
VTVSLSEFKGASGGDVVRAVGVFSDESDVFYLGRVRLLVDRRPIELSIEAVPLMARPDEVIEFSVSWRGGAIDPRATWDFDETDGIQQEAVGVKTSYLYKEPGDYMVTCSVSDRDGVRSPISKGVGIKVVGPE